MRPLALALFAMSLSTAAVSGETSTEAMAEYRHTYFESLGKHMKMTGMIAKGVVDRPEDAVANAVSLHEMSKYLTELFPESSKGDGSRALPAIWDDAKGFAKAAKKLETETGKLVDVAKKGDVAALGAQLKQVGMSCGGCHDSFRAEEE